MGRQVNYYMTDADESDFMYFLQSQSGAQIFEYAQSSNFATPLPRLPERGARFWYAIWLWRSDISPPPVLEYVPEQSYWVVNRNASEVIEFSRSHLYENQLVRGRLWTEMSGWLRDRPEVVFRKSREFEKWYKQLVTWIKRRSVRDEVGDYLLPGAEAYRKSGGALVQAVFSSKVKIVKHTS